MPQLPRTDDELIHAMGVHQAVLATFEIATHPEQSATLIPAFERLVATATTSRATASKGIRHGLGVMIYTQTNILRAQGTRGAVSGWVSEQEHERRCAAVMENLPTEAAKTVALARTRHPVEEYLSALERGDDGRPISTVMLLRAAVQTMLAHLSYHSDGNPDTAWFLVGQNFTAICLEGL